MENSGVIRLNGARQLLGLAITEREIFRIRVLYLERIFCRKKLSHCKVFYSWTCDVLSLRDKCIKTDHPCVGGDFGRAFVLPGFTIVEQM